MKQETKKDLKNFGIMLGTGVAVGGTAAITFGGSVPVIAAGTAIGTQVGSYLTRSKERKKEKIANAHLL